MFPTSCSGLGAWVVLVGESDAILGRSGLEDSLALFRERHADRGAIQVTGLAHLDSEDPAQLLALEAAVRQRSGSGGPWEYEVSLVGGYDDDRSCSRDITDTLLFTMQVCLLDLTISKLMEYSRITLPCFA